MQDAGKAHHDYESNYLKGKRDDYWAGWYAAFVIGRVGNFATPTELTNWLEEVESGDNWFENAANLILDRLA